MWLLEQTTEEWGFAYFHNRPKVQWRFSTKETPRYYRQIYHAEAMEISTDVASGKKSTGNVNPSGEYLGCVQWFQHSQPSVIVRRDSRDRCTYFDQRLVTPGILWDYHMSQWVKSGDWKEITQQEAERRIEQNRMPEELKAQEPQPGICKREQYASGGTPSPRNCDVCLEGPCPRVIPVQSESGTLSSTQEPCIKILPSMTNFKTSIILKRISWFILL
jgi:hypothetical protein